MNIRPITKDDLTRVAEIVQGVGNFKPEEMRIALELAEEALDDPEESGYFASVLEHDGVVHGYICYGPVPLTDGTYDLYWIAVDPLTQGRGYGKALSRFAEKDIAARGGRFLVIETSSVQSYAATIRFYEKGRYELAATLKDFYRPGDDKLIFIKRLDLTKKPARIAEETATVNSDR
jgi:ribosomal protein S18 acetylase RimI-like enzyme